MSHGLSWESFHRGQPGRDYGFWHHRKALVELEPLQQESDCIALPNDPEWLQFLRDHPTVEFQPDDKPVSPPVAAPAPGTSAKPK